MAIDVGVQLKMNNSDFLRGVASSKIGMASLKKEWQSYGRQVNANNKVMREAESELEKLNQRASRMTHTSRALSLNFYELRNAIRNTVTRAAITGFGAIAGALDSIVASAGAAAGSIGNLAGGLALAGGGGLVAALQGISVAMLGLSGVMKALTTTGKAHEQALANLTPAARAFEKSLTPIRNLFREIKVLSQAGIFPGLENAVKRLTPFFKTLKQVTYDTAVNIGYLADRASSMLTARKGQIGAILKNNVVLIQNYGRALENIGAGVIDVWDAAIPLMDHVSAKVLKFSDGFKRSMREWSKNGSLSEFFSNFKESFDNWWTILGSFGKTLFNIFQSAQPAAHRLERDVIGIFQHFADFTSKHKGEMEGFFIRGLEPMRAFAHLVGDIVKAIFNLGNLGQNSATAFFNVLDTKVLPILVSIVTVLQKDFTGAVGDMVSALLDFVKEAQPGLESLLKPVSYIAEGFATILRTMTKLVDYGNDHFGKLGGVISTALAVGVVTASWVALRIQIGLVRNLLGGGIKKLAAAPGQLIVTGGKKAASNIPLLGGYRSYQAEQAAYDAERRNMPQAFHSISFVDAETNKKRLNRLRVAQQQVIGYGTEGEPVLGYPSTGSGTRPRTMTPYRGVNARRFNPALPENAPRGLPGGGVGSRPLSSLAIPFRGGRPTSSLAGGEGEKMFQEYRRKMQTETQSGFLGGLKNMFKGSKGTAALGTLGMLTGNVALALAIPVGIAAVGALSKAFKDNRPKLVQDVQNVGAGLGPKQIIASRAGSRFVPQQSPIFSRLASDLNQAIKDKNIVGIQKVQTELGLLGDTIQNLGKRNEIGHLTDQLGTLAAQTSNALLSQVNPDFQNFASATKDSVNHTMDALFVLKDMITAKLPVAGAEYKQAMASAFAGAADAIRTEIANGQVSEKAGLKAIHDLLLKEYKELGFSPEQAKNLISTHGADPTGKKGGNENPGGMGHVGYTTTKTSGVSTAARGGYIKGQGMVGHDSVPMSVDGRKIITAPGEYVGIFTRHQQRSMEQATGMPMGDFFEKHKTPHYASKGGIWKLGEKIQGMDYAGSPYMVSENSHFGGVHPVHVKNSLHYKDEALDVNHDIPAGSEKGALDKLNSLLTSEGWHTLWQVAGHFDHLHVDDANGNGSGTGSMSSVLKFLKAPKIAVTGLVSGLIQGTLNQATGAANAALRTVGDSSGASGIELEGSTKGGGSPSKNKDLARRMMRRFGWGSDEWPPLDKLGTQESGWSTTALNKSSGAFGIGQFLGKTKDDYAKYGATSHSAGQQINAMFHYIKDRYGDPAGAWAHETAYNWYAAGGPAPPPTSGNKQPPVSPHDAIPKAPKSKSKTKKKKKVRIAGGKPPLGAGIGPNSFKPASKHPKAKARKSIKKLISKPFNITDPDLTDPITGEPIDIGKYGPLLSITGIDNAIASLNTMLDSVTNTASLTDEEAIVSLYDSDQYPDLTSYLKTALGKDDAGVLDWVNKYGDTMDVVNQSGMSVQGTFTRGISQAVGELQAQLAFHTTTPILSNSLFGIKGGLQAEFNTANQIPSARAITERVARLAQVKKIFEANVELRKTYKKKLSGMTSGSYTWQQAVNHNEDIITAWRRWKRDSINEPQSATDTANHEMDRLSELNKSLKRSKPKGRVYGSAEYQNTLGIYQGRGIENRMLVGDKDATAWAPQSAGGYVGQLAGALSNWRSIDSERTNLITSLPGQITTEQDNINALNTTIAQWTGTRVTPQPINRSSGDQSNQELNDLKLQNSMDQLRNALLGSTQFDVLKNFASILGMRMLGAYAHGGLVPETGMALVHKGEYITPSANGPFRNGMNAMGGGDTHLAVELHMRDRAGALVELVDSRVRKVAPGYVSKTTGRKSRMISTAPGR